MLPNQEEMRVLTLRAVALLIIAEAILLEVALEFVPGLPFTASSIAVVALGGCGLVTLALHNGRPIVAGLELVLVLSVICIGTAMLSTSIFPLFVLPLVAIIAGTVLDRYASFGVAGVVGVSLLVLSHLFGEESIFSTPVVIWTTLVMVVAAVLVWLATRPMRHTLTWAWDSYAQTLELTEKLRDRQQELAEALKSLNQAYYQLEGTTKELARARTAADEARRVKSELAANISHELRTPLNLIIGFSELLLFSRSDREVLLSPTHRGDVEAIYRNAQHLSDLINDVLELGEIEAGRMGLRKDWTQLRAIVDGAMSIVATLLEDKGLRAWADIPDDLPPIYVDATRIRQVLINLLNNAARFTDHGGIRITARSDGSNVVVTAADTGVGMSEDDLPHVFDEFRQFGDPNQRRGIGSGLGLSICKKMVELHGGNIWVESVRGKGTTFTFTLPLGDNVAGALPHPPWETWAHPPEHSELARQHVFVVSRDPTATRIIQRHLDGYQIQAFDQFSGLPDDLPIRAVIQVIDKHDALEPALDEIATRDLRCPILVCRMPSERDLCADLRVTRYLVKPFAREHLLEAIDQIDATIRTILVVDDDPNIVELIARTLVSHDGHFRVLRAYNGEQALAMLDQSDEPIDLLILDLLMPPPDGFAVLTTLQASRRFTSLPIIVVSARGFIDRGITCDLLALTSSVGFTVREVMGCTRALIQTLSARSEGDDTASQSGETPCQE